MNKSEACTILGISPGADKDSIKKAYRKSAIKYHPDKNPGNKEAEGLFRRATEAYEILSEKHPKMQSFSDEYSNPFRGPGFRTTTSRNGRRYPKSAFERFYDSFNVSFGNNGEFHFDFDLFINQSKYKDIYKRPKYYKPPEIHIDFYTEIEESFSETEKHVIYYRNFDCEACSSKGGGLKKCSCSGINPYCSVCHGSGFSTIACPECSGSGFILKKEEISVRLPRGIKEGDKLIVKNKGHTNLDSTYQDLYVCVHERPNTRFKRNKRDIITTLEISFSQAVFGSTYFISTPAGENVEVKTKPLINSGDVVRIPSYGAYYPRSDKRGDLLVKVKLVTPTNLSDEKRGIFERLRELETEDITNA